MKPKVYLAGPITALTYQEAIEWRKHVAIWLMPDIDAFSPLRRKDYLQHENKIKDQYGTSVGYGNIDIKNRSRAAIMSNQRAIYARDFNDVITSQAIIANFTNTDRVSIGTVMEVAWAAMARIPVILVMEEENNLHDHSMIREAVAYRVTSIEDAADIARMLLLP